MQHHPPGKSRLTMVHASRHHALGLVLGTPICPHLSLEPHSDMAVPHQTPNHCPKTRATLAIADAAVSDAPLQRARRWDCPAHDALAGLALHDPPRVGSATSGPDETLPQLFEPTQLKQFL